MSLPPWHRSRICTSIPVSRSTTASTRRRRSSSARAALGYGALALTDTNGLYGAVPFCKAAKAAGIAPLLGAEIDGGNAGWSARGRARARAGGLPGALPDRDAAASGELDEGSLDSPTARHRKRTPGWRGGEVSVARTAGSTTEVRSDRTPALCTDAVTRLVDLIAAEAGSVVVLAAAPALLRCARPAAARRDALRRAGLRPATRLRVALPRDARRVPRARPAVRRDQRRALRGARGVRDAPRAARHRRERHRLVDDAARPRRALSEIARGDGRALRAPARGARGDGAHRRGVRLPDRLRGLAFPGGAPAPRRDAVFASSGRRASRGCGSAIARSRARRWSGCATSSRSSRRRASPRTSSSWTRSPPRRARGACGRSGAARRPTASSRTASA